MSEFPCSKLNRDQRQPTDLVTKFQRGHKQSRLLRSAAVLMHRRGDLLQDVKTTHADIKASD
jgi:hypothetical protein